MLRASEKVLQCLMQTIIDKKRNVYSQQQKSEGINKAVCFSLMEPAAELKSQTEGIFA
jgi:hypothetical protein